ncbi:LVIVD repeat-containing protein [Candidatus Lokiarchaeum ossiferum]|uniref:LVIVD repeat-containing protein n=1 Tax=Candidatus Lokiarchaeum ossiferum TaxID=2951803 RepID=UPI00352F9EA4
MNKNLRFCTFFIVSFVVSVCFFSEAHLATSTTLTEDPYEIVKIGSLEDSPGIDIQVVDNVAFVMSFTDGFSTYDISNPAKPKKLDSYAPTNTINPIVHGAHALDIKDDYAFIAFYHSGVQILDISNPSNIALIGEFKGGPEYYYSSVYGDLMHCIKHKRGFEVINCSDPTDPNILGSYSVGNYYIYNYAYKNLAFLQDSTQGKAIVLNISDFSNILPITSFPFKMNQMQIVHDLAYFALDSGELKIYNISDILHPELINNYSLGGSINDLEVIDDLAFLSHSTGLKILNISNVLSPFEVNKYVNAKSGGGLTVSKNNAYIIFDDRDVEIYQWREATDDEVLLAKNIPSYSVDWILGWSSIVLIVLMPWKKRKMFF